MRQGEIRARVGFSSAWRSTTQDKFLNATTGLSIRRWQLQASFRADRVQITQNKLNHRLLIYQVRCFGVS
jgi:hypothetical protein